MDTSCGFFSFFFLSCKDTVLPPCLRSDLLREKEMQFPTLCNNFSFLIKYSSIEFRNASDFLTGQEMNLQVKQQQLQMKK